MRNDHVTLRSTAVFDLLAPRTPAVPVQVELRYDTKDPYAVVAAFRTGRAGWVEWVFARDLLAAYNVAVLPGSYLAREASGVNPGAHHVRVALVAAPDECLEGIRRIHDFARNL